ncbi:MAG: hypothetical protein CMJ85_06475 [Planctomycetes bacterium]|nr:hypothetical protein [Planctomycetota bacterium]
MWGEAGVVFVGFLLVYLTLGQSVFYKGDGPWIVKRLIDGSTDYPHHKLYMPMLVAFGDLVAPLGMTPYRTGVVFSAVGSALGVCLAHVAFRWLVPGRAWLATLLLGLCPAVLLFATVVEFHGVLLGFAGIAFLLAAHLAIKPGWIVAVALGIATSVAAGVHSSGLVLPGVLLPWFLARRWHIGTRQHDLLLCGIAGALHLGGAFLLAKPDQATHFLETGFSHPQGIEHLPGILHVEWLTAFFPLSIVVFAAAFRRGLRLQLLAFVIGMAPYLYAALRLLVGDAEFGAYLLPLAFVAALLTAIALPRLATALLVLTSATFGIVQVRQHDDNEYYRAYAAGLNEVFAGKPALLLVGNPAEVGPILVHGPRLTIYPLNEVAEWLPELVRKGLPIFDKVVRDTTRNHPVWLTAGARTYLSTTADGHTPGGPTLLAHIQATYGLVETKAHAFHGWRLVPK